MDVTLSRWLRLLWNLDPPLKASDEGPFISDGTIHLPPVDGDWRAALAPAAHAAAHLVYSPPRFDPAGLVPVNRVLLALLEDARVEALAMRELPGLARLWRPLHRATPGLGGSFEALLQRLSRALIDPAYDDPDPWICKGRSLFFLDIGLRLPALRTPADLRHAAMQLGHDIGQQRLPFNSRDHRPAPGYRDDHRWMWPADQLREVAPDEVQTGLAGEVEPAGEQPVAGTWTVPEWDRLIARLRPDWCRVSEQPWPAGGIRTPAPDELAQRAAGRLIEPLRRLAQADSRLRRSVDGEQFDLSALVEWRVARRANRQPDARVHRRRVPQHGRAEVCLLLDLSASSGTPGQGGAALLDTARGCTLALAQALQAAGIGCSILGFNSHGRHDVRIWRVKLAAQPFDAAVRARLAALRPSGSTRIGAALRSAARGLAARDGGPRWLVLLSDADAHDTDVHDAAYLGADASQALQACRRQAIRAACLVLGSADRIALARRLFGRPHAQPVGHVDQLPRAIERLLA